MYMYTSVHIHSLQDVFLAVGEDMWKETKIIID